MHAGALERRFRFDEPFYWSNGQEIPLLNERSIR